MNSQHMPGRKRTFLIPGYGALVISLDFELHWGVRDSQPVNGPYRANLLGARAAVPRMLDLFEEFDIGATWATVGFLFARSRMELERFSPILRPEYAIKTLDPYQEPLGESEADDPLHFAPSLIEEICRRRRQELATHTFSHYYCQEEGETAATFREDLLSACRIAERYKAKMRSIVFPRMQYKAEYAPILREMGITSYRGTERHWMYSGESVAAQRTPWRRAARIADNYISLSGSNITHWSDVPQEDGLCNIASSRFLRPYSETLAMIEPLRLHRMLSALEAAAENKAIFHLNWHPHNFGLNLEANLRVLRSIFEHYKRLHDSHGMRALAMKEVVEALHGPQIHAAEETSRDNTRTSGGGDQRNPGGQGQDNPALVR